MKLDWQQIAFLAAKANGGQYKLAAQLGVSRTVLAELSRGAHKEPKYFAVCVALLAVYSRTVRPVPGAEELAGVLAE